MVWLYHRYTLSFRDIKLRMAERGVGVSNETICTCCVRFGAGYARRCRGNAPTSRQVTSRRGVLEDQWRAKACVAGGIGPGRKRHRHLIQSKRDGRAASRFFRILLKHQCHPPRVLITDRLGSYRVADRRRWRKLSAAEQVFEQQVRRIPITTAARTDNERVPPHRSARPSGFCPQSVGSPHFHPPPRRRMTATDYPAELAIRFEVWDRLTEQTLAA